MPPLPPSFSSWLDYYRFIVARLPSNVDPLDRSFSYYEIKHVYLNGTHQEITHSILLWQLKWLAFDEIQPMLPNRAEAIVESNEIGYALTNHYIPPRANYKVIDLLEFLFQSQKMH